MKYTCSYYGGGGTKYDGGIWELKETPKVLQLKQIKESFFQPNYTDIRIQKFYTRDSHQTKKGGSAYRELENYGAWMNNGHVLRDWHDGTYTAYPHQCGTPYVFEPIADHSPTLLKP